MYCKNCGNQMNDQAAVCLKCGASAGTGNKFCPNCGGEVGENAAVCLKCGINLSKANDNGGNIGEKSKTAAGLLSIFLGHLGIHWFYLGFSSKGVINIVISFVSAITTLFLGLGILGFIGLFIYNVIIAIKIFTDKTFTDAQGKLLQ